MIKYFTFSKKSLFLFHFHSRASTLSSTKHPLPLRLPKTPPCFSPKPLSNPIIPSTKTHLYASLFCTLIHLYLSCGRYSHAKETFFKMRKHGVIPVLTLWNHLIYSFNASGLVSEVMLLYSEMLACGFCLIFSP